MTPSPVVVGVDGSAASLAAVDLAVREAVLRHRALRVVHAFIWPYLHTPLGPAPLGPADGGLRNQADRLVAEAVTRARAAAPQLPVSGQVVTGAAVPVLLAQAREAAEVVIGDRGLGGFTGLLLGSVAVQLTAHAPGPVLVARGEVDPARPVLVGVDRSPANQAAIGYAFEEAALRQVPLTAVHAWTLPPSTGPTDALLEIADAAQAEQDRLLAEALVDWYDKYPEVTVHRLVRYGAPRQVLIQSSGRAQLIVVGTRGAGGFTGLLLGSVSQAVLHHAHCPVAVVRG